MYCYFPEHRFGQDMIAWTTGVTGNPGDLIGVDERLAIIWGEDIVRSEDMHGAVTAVTSEMIIPGILSFDARAHIDQMVAHRLTSYAATIPLWIGNDITAIRKYKPKKSQHVVREREVVVSSEEKLIFQSCASTSRQQMIVFPDLWTMHQQVPQRVFEQPGVVRRHSGLTSVQKAKIFRGCAYGQIHTLITTPAGVFQDWRDLGSVCLIDAHKWRYKAGHEPRYRVPSVLRHWAEKKDISLMCSGVLLNDGVLNG